MDRSWKILLAVLVFVPQVLLLSRVADVTTDTYWDISIYAYASPQVATSLASSLRESEPDGNSTDRRGNERSIFDSSKMAMGAVMAGNDKEGSSSARSGWSGGRDKVPSRSDTLLPPFMFYTVPDHSKQSQKERRLREGCERMNPGYESRVYDDVSSRKFVADFFPQFLQLYDSLDKPVMQADMFRYLVLFHFGGVYFDSDVECKVPIDEWGDVLIDETPMPASNQIKEKVLGAMVGIEIRGQTPGDETVAVPTPIQFVQWTMASKPGHPLFYRTVEKINETIAATRAGSGKAFDVVYTTGPGIFSEAVVEYMVEQGRLREDQVLKSPGAAVLVNDSSITESSDFLVGNVAILHSNAFARSLLGKSTDTGPIYVDHKFAGRWKTGNFIRADRQNGGVGTARGKLGKHLRQTSK